MVEQASRHYLYEKKKILGWYTCICNKYKFKHIYVSKTYNMTYMPVGKTTVNKII